MFSGPHRYNLDNSYPRRSRQSSAKYDTKASWSEAEKTRRRKLMWVKNAMKIFVQLKICLNIRLDLVLKWAKIELNSMLIHNSTEILKHSRVFRNFSVFFFSSLSWLLTNSGCVWLWTAVRAATSESTAMPTILHIFHCASSGATRRWTSTNVTLINRL